MAIDFHKEAMYNKQVSDIILEIRQTQDAVERLELINSIKDLEVAKTVIKKLLR